MKNAIVLLLALALAGCGGTRSAEAAAPKTVADFFTIRVGQRSVRMQIAVRPPEMERGLMERRDLAPDQGMIFIFSRPQQLDFWMHDTPTALDVGFFTPDGELAEVYPMFPFDERTVQSLRSDLQFALEMNQGWFARNGVRPGAHLDMAALNAALKARGFEPIDFALSP